MYAGKLVEEATTALIFGEPLHPYTQFLINSLPRFGDKTTRESAPGSPPSLSALPEGCPFHPRCPHAMAHCREEMPDLIKLDAVHRVACWLVGGGQDAKAS
jgi:peptide/nickel transport system ATP-binding protein